MFSYTSTSSRDGKQSNSYELLSEILSKGRTIKESSQDTRKLSKRINTTHPSNQQVQKSHGIQAAHSKSMLQRSPTGNNRPNSKHIPHIQRTGCSSRENNHSSRSEKSFKRSVSRSNHQSLTSPNFLLDSGSTTSSTSASKNIVSQLAQALKQVQNKQNLTTRPTTPDKPRAGSDVSNVSSQAPASHAESSLASSENQQTETSVPSPVLSGVMRQLFNAATSTSFSPAIDKHLDSINSLINELSEDKHDASKQDGIYSFNTESIRSTGNNASSAMVTSSFATEVLQILRDPVSEKTLNDVQSLVQHAMSEIEQESSRLTQTFAPVTHDSSLPTYATMSHPDRTPFISSAQYEWDPLKRQISSQEELSPHSILWNKRTQCGSADTPLSNSEKTLDLTFTNFVPGKNTQQSISSSTSTSTTTTKSTFRTTPRAHRSSVLYASTAAQRAIGNTVTTSKGKIGKTQSSNKVKTTFMNYNGISKSSTDAVKDVGKTSNVSELETKIPNETATTLQVARPNQSKNSFAINSNISSSHTTPLKQISPPKKATVQGLQRLRRGTISSMLRSGQVSSTPHSRSPNSKRP